jgi:hypothetical protein
MVGGTCADNPHYVSVVLMEGTVAGQIAAYDSDGQLLQSHNTVPDSYEQYEFEEEDIAFLAITTPGNETFMDEIYVECE